MTSLALSDASRSDGSCPTRAPSRLVKRAVLVIVALFAALTAAFLVGFVRFASGVAALEPPPALAADGIVVLTGGAERIAGGLDLLADGRAGRLLISGVHPDTDAADIGRALGAPADMFACCVDLDHTAVDTAGNAAETAKWARSNRLGSLIVVTSAYHMPRSMMELQEALPDRELVPFPVSRPGLELADWYRDPDKMRLLFTEYVKFTLAEARVTLGDIAS